ESGPTRVRRDDAGSSTSQQVVRVIAEIPTRTEGPVTHDLHRLPFSVCRSRRCGPPTRMVKEWNGPPSPDAHEPAGAPARGSVRAARGEHVLLHGVPSAVRPDHPAPRRFP